MRRIQEGFGDELRKNHTETIKAQDHCQIKTARAIEESQIRTETVNDTGLQKLATTIESLAGQTSTNNALSTPLPPAQPPTRDYSLDLSLSFENKESIDKYFLNVDTTAIRASRAQNIDEIINLLNQQYDTPAQKISSSESRIFMLKRLVPDEQGGAGAGSGYGNSEDWAAWVNKATADREDRVKVKVVLKLVLASDRPSKKRKIDCDVEGKAIDGEDVSEGRNYFRAHCW